MEFVEPKYNIKYHTIYVKWLNKLKDVEAEALIAARLRRIRKYGNFGDHKHVGDSVWELRIDYGPGYRLYYTQWGNRVVLLLCGGDKSSQISDIERAKRLAKETENV